MHCFGAFSNSPFCRLLSCPLPRPHSGLVWLPCWGGVLVLQLPWSLRLLGVPLMLSMLLWQVPRPPLANLIYWSPASGRVMP